MTLAEEAEWIEKARRGELPRYYHGVSGGGFYREIDGEIVPVSSVDALRWSMEQHPDWYATLHARALGLSRGRIRQIAQENGITLPRKQRKVYEPKPRHPRTHCRNGHLLGGENAYAWDKSRRCKACWNSWQRAHKRAERDPARLREYRSRYEAKKAFTR